MAMSLMSDYLQVVPRTPEFSNSTYFNKRTNVFKLFKDNYCNGNSL